MNKKLKFVIALMSLLLLTTLLVACDPDTHSHLWSTDWDKDDIHHWHNCTADGCDITDNAQKDGYAAHNFSNGNCICGQPKPHAHSWSNIWDKNNTHHWHNCTADGCDITDNAQKDGYAVHDFTNGNCICGQPKPHSHSWSNIWDKDGAHHWHNCTADGCDITDNSQKDGYAIHDFTNGNCVCGQPKPTEGLEYTLNPDGASYSVTGIGEATDANIIIPTIYGNNPVTAISYRAFYGCTAITNIIIPNSITSIEERAFCGCTSLTSIPIPNSVTSIGASAFENCDDLQYNEHDNVLYLGNSDNPFLALIKASKEDILYCAIYPKTKLIADSAFRSCSALQSITVPDSVTSIGKDAFVDCVKLSSIIIGSGVKSIGKMAFSGCTSLTSITIPDNVTSIGKSAFEGCDALQYNEHDNALYLGNSDNPFFALIKASNKDILYCAIYPKTKLIADFAFGTCFSLKSITIPDSVTSIGEDAFVNCVKLSKIIIGSGVKSIGVMAFCGCTSLTSVTIPDNVTSIYWHTFYQCYNITNITLSNGLTSISHDTFSGCGKLESIVIPDGVTSIGRSAFADCTSLASVTIPDSVTDIGQNAFNGCTALVTINFNGTMAQWKEMIKKLNWDTNTGDFTVHCTDGVLDKGCTEI